MMKFSLTTGSRYQIRKATEKRNSSSVQDAAAESAVFGLVSKLAEVEWTN